MVASFGSVQGPSWSGHGGAGCTPKLFGVPEENLTKSYKFMFQKALDVREGDAVKGVGLGEVTLTSIWVVTLVFGGGLWCFSPSVVLSWRIEELGDALKNHHHLEEFTSVLLPAQVKTPAWVSPQHPAPTFRGRFGAKPARFFSCRPPGTGDGAGPDRL